MVESTRIAIASDFSETPFGRYESDGLESGQVFRDKILLPHLRADHEVILDLDGVAGLPSSFWEEVLGGAVRAGITPDRLRRLLTIETKQPDLKTYIRIGWKYVDEAAKKVAR